MVRCAVWDVLTVGFESDASFPDSSVFPGDDFCSVSNFSSVASLSMMPSLPQTLLAAFRCKPLQDEKFQELLCGHNKTCEINSRFISISTQKFSLSSDMPESIPWFFSRAARRHGSSVGGVPRDVQGRRSGSHPRLFIRVEVETSKQRLLLCVYKLNHS